MMIFGQGSGREPGRMPSRFSNLPKDPIRLLWILAVLELIAMFGAVIIAFVYLVRFR